MPRKTSPPKKNCPDCPDTFNGLVLQKIQEIQTLQRRERAVAKENNKLIDSLKADLKDRDSELQTARNLLENTSQVIAQLQETLNSRNEEIVTLHQKHQKAILEKDFEIDLLYQTVLNSENKVKRLEQALKRANRIPHDIEIKLE